MKTDKEFITKPSNSKVYHIFHTDRRSYCGKIAILFPREDSLELFTGKEKWSKGQDCKACFKKANLIEVHKR